MKDETPLGFREGCFIFPPSSLILPLRRRSQVVRQRSAKPLFIGSIPIAASSQALLFPVISRVSPPDHCYFITFVPVLRSHN